MNTEIEYLTLIERDLKDAAVREMSRTEVADPAATPARTRPGQRWVRVAGVAATFVVVAGAIGFLADGQSGSTKFSQIGSAGSGGGNAPQPASGDAPHRAVGRDEEAGFDAFAPEAGPPTGSDKATLGGVTFSIGQQGQQQRDLSKIIRDGRIGVTVDDGTFKDNVDALTDIAARNGGFVLSSSTQREREGTFTLRIPANHFDRALLEIGALGTVRFQEVTGDDVTAEFIDYQARLQILLQRKALLSHLLQDANTTDEILRLSSLIDDVQLRIEQIQGQIRFINDQVAEATLRVSIQEKNAPHTEPAPDIENPNLGSSFDVGVQGFLRIVGAVIVGLGYLIPITIIGGLIWLGAVWIRRRRTA